MITFQFVAWLLPLQTMPCDRIAGFWLASLFTTTMLPDDRLTLSKRTSYLQVLLEQKK